MVVLLASMINVFPFWSSWTDEPILSSLSVVSLELEQVSAERSTSAGRRSSRGVISDPRTSSFRLRFVGSDFGILEVLDDVRSY